LFKDDHGAEATLTLAATSVHLCSTLCALVGPLAGAEPGPSLILPERSLQTGLMYLSCIFFSPLLARYPWYRPHMQLLGLSAAVIGIIGSGFATKVRPSLSRDLGSSETERERKRYREGC